MGMVLLWGPSGRRFLMSEAPLLCCCWPWPFLQCWFCLRILVYLVIHDSGWVSLEHLLLSWYPSQSLDCRSGVPVQSRSRHRWYVSWFTWGADSARYWCAVRTRPRWFRTIAAREQPHKFSRVDRGTAPLRTPLPVGPCRSPTPRDLW